MESSPLSAASSRPVSGRFQLPNLLPAAGSASSLLEAVVGPDHSAPDPAPSTHRQPQVSAGQHGPSQRSQPSPLTQDASQAAPAPLYTSDAGSPSLLGGGRGEETLGSADVGRSGSIGSWSVLSDGESKANSSALPPPPGDVTYLSKGRAVPGQPGATDKVRLQGSVVEELSPEEKEKLEEMERVLEKRKSNIPQLESELATLEAKIRAAEEKLARVNDPRATASGGRS